MIKEMKYIGLLFLLISCNRGIWITKNAYRPKHAKFSITKKPFVPNLQINSNFLYVSKTKFISNSQEKVMFDFIGFYSDGRMIGTSLTNADLDRINKLNSWETAFSIGYYSTMGNKLLYEYFIPGEGGSYVKMEGFIKKDTIILITRYRPLLEKEVRYDTLLKTEYPLL